MLYFGKKDAKHTYVDSNIKSGHQDLSTIPAKKLNKLGTYRELKPGFKIKCSFGRSDEPKLMTEYPYKPENKPLSTIKLKFKKMPTERKNPQILIQSLDTISQDEGKFLLDYYLNAWSSFNF